MIAIEPTRIKQCCWWWLLYIVYIIQWSRAVLLTTSTSLNQIIRKDEGNSVSSYVITRMSYTSCKIKMEIWKILYNTVRWVVMRSVVTLSCRSWTEIDDSCYSDHVSRNDNDKRFYSKISLLLYSTKLTF